MSLIKQMCDLIDYYNIVDCVATRLFSKKYLFILYLEHSKKLLDFAYDKIKLSAKEFADLLESAFYTALVYRNEYPFMYISNNLSEKQIKKFYTIRFISAAFFIGVILGLTIHTKDFLGLIPMLLFTRIVYPAYLMKNGILEGGETKTNYVFYDNIKTIIPLPDHPLCTILAFMILFPAFSPLSILLRFFTESIIISYHKIFNKTHHLRSFTSVYNLLGLYSYIYLCTVLMHFSSNFGSDSIGAILTMALMLHNVFFLIFGLFRMLPEGLRFLIGEVENRLMFLPYFLMRFDPLLYQKVIPKARYLGYLKEGILAYIYKDYYTKVMFCEGELCPLTFLPYFDKKSLEKRINALWHGSQELRWIIGTYLKDKEKYPPKVYYKKYLEAHADHNLYDLGAIKYVELECVHVEPSPDKFENSESKLNRYYFKITDDLYISVNMFAADYALSILEPVITPDRYGWSPRFSPRILSGEEFRAIKNKSVSLELKPKTTNLDSPKNKEELLNEYMKRLELYNLD